MALRVRDGQVTAGAGRRSAQGLEEDQRLGHPVLAVVEGGRVPRVPHGMHGHDVVQVGAEAGPAAHGEAVDGHGGLVDGEAEGSVVLSELDANRKSLLLSGRGKDERPVHPIGSLLVVAGQTSVDTEERLIDNANLEVEGLMPQFALGVSHFPEPW